MTIASTQLAMSYVGRTESADNCGTCAHAIPQVWPKPTGLKCKEGAFYTTRHATCRKFIKADQPSKVQVGPTDI